MKYKFIINKPVLDGQFVALSETEKDIVIATVIGNYSLFLEGFQTKRITKAIKLLRDINKPFVTVYEDNTENELIGNHNKDGVREGLVTEADGGYLYTEDLSSLPHGIQSWINTVMHNTWIKLCCMGRGTVTLPANFKLIAETEKRTDGIDFMCIVDMCDIRYRCEEVEDREVYSLAYLKEEIDGIKTFYKDFDNDAIRLTERAQSSIPLLQCKENTIRLAKTLSTIKGHSLVTYNDLDSAYKLTK
jgi:hypothetical protein